LDSKKTLETSYGHKKKEDGEQEAPLRKLSKVNPDKQTSKGKQTLNDLTKKAARDGE
jgi:hypothetical protein